jgi:hypothetical protein
VHSFARLRGFGIAIVPNAPYVIRRIGDGSDDRIAIDHDGRRAVIDPRADAHSGEWNAVAEVSAAVGAKLWHIDFSRHTVEWPNNFALASSELAGVPFELWGTDGALISPQGPYDPAPTPEQMVAPGQHLVATGHDEDLVFAEVGYRHEDLAWRQRHTVCPAGWVITAQAIEAQAQPLFAVAARLARQMND